MNTVLSKNLKKLRLEKNLTQEKVAAALGVNPQTVSRWECGITLPDVLILPEIAKLFCVSIDDLYKTAPSTFENHFQRLAFLYHQTKNPEDFFCAFLEFKKMKLKSFEDIRIYGLMNQFMMANCINTALTSYDQVINNKEKVPSDTYRKAKYSKADILSLLANLDCFIAEQYKTIKNNPDDVDELCVLLTALCYSKDYKKAYAIFEKNISRFQDNGSLYFVGGNICKGLNISQKAFEYWDKAIDLSDELCLDIKYSKAYYYEELGQWENAYNQRLEIAKELHRADNEKEAEIQEKYAKIAFERMNKD